MHKTFETKLLLFTFLIILLLSPICMASDITPISSTLSLEAISSDDSIDSSTSYKHIESDIYEFNDEVVIDSIVDGNAFVMGNNITISGEIGGDLFVLGSNITVSEDAYIQGNIFALGQNFTMNGICYDIFSVSENFTLGEKAMVVRDIRVISDNTKLDGKVRRDAYINTNSLSLSNLITGDLNYTSSSEIEIDDKMVGGNINYTPSVSEEPSMAETITSYIFDIISSLLYSLVIILLIVWLAPKFKENSSTILKKQAPASFGIGILSSIIIIVASLILLFLINGIAVGISFAAIAIFILALTISKTVFCMSCAKLAIDKFKKDSNLIFILISLLISLILNLVSIIPFVGVLVSFITTMIGLGIMVLNIIKSRKLNNDKYIEINQETNN